MSYLKDDLQKIKQLKARKQKLQSDLAHLQKTVATNFKLTPSRLTEKTRTKEIALARQIAMFLARNPLNYQFHEIAQSFQRDRTTVIYAYYKLKEQLSKNPSLQETITHLTNQILRDLTPVERYTAHRGHVEVLMELLARRETTPTQDKTRAETP